MACSIGNATVVATLSLLLCLAGMQSVSAQSKLTEGEEVKVFYLNSWFDGVVLGRDKNRYGVEFEFAATKKRELFDRAQVRKACEIDAMDLARTWESANGKFKIEAALKTFSSDQVTLAKIDGTEVDVPVDSLGEKDQLYLKKFRKAFDEAVSKGEVPASVPKLPPLETFESIPQSNIGSIIGQGTVEPLGAIPNYLREFQQGGTGFYFARADQDPVAVIPVGGPEQWVLLTAREDNFKNRGVNFQSQAYWISLKQQKMTASVPLSPEDYIVDYDPRIKLLVSVHRDSTTSTSNSGSITIWNLKPGETEAQPIVRWQSDLNSWTEPLFIKLVNDHTVLVKSGRQTYTAWDFKSKQAVYAFKTTSFFDTNVVVTTDRKHALIPEDGKVTVINTQDGQLKFSLPVADSHVSGININPEGNRLACLSEANLHVWDLTSPTPTPTVYRAPMIGSPFQSRIEWIDDDSILAESHMQRILYRLSAQLPIWSYRLDGSQILLNRTPLTNQSLNGLLFYIADPDPNSGAIAVGAVKLPGPQVDELTKSLDPKSLNLLKPGVRVGLAIGKVTEPAMVEKWLVEKIQSNGWIYDPNAPIKMHAEMGVSETRTETYHQMSARGGTTTVTFTPHFASLNIKLGDTAIWQSGTSTGAPPIVHGGDLQAEIAKNEVPQLEFFRYVTIPSEVIDPKYSRGFGVSKLGLKGIEVVSTTPPGRETP